MNREDRQKQRQRDEAREELVDGRIDEARLNELEMYCPVCDKPHKIASLRGDWEEK